MTRQHKDLTSQHKDLTSRHNYLTGDGRNMPPYIGDNFLIDAHIAFSVAYRLSAHVSGTY